MPFKKAGSLCLYAIFAMIFVATALPCHAREAVKLQLRWHHGFQFAGYYMAMEKGLYREAGLDLEMLEGGVEIDHVVRVANGRADFGVATSELVVERLKGAPLKVLAVVFQHSPYVLMVRKEAGVGNPQQLFGKKVYLGLIPRMAEIQAMFVHEGVPLDRLEIVDAVKFPPDYDNPEILAFTAYLTNEPYLLERAGIEFNLIKPVSYGIDFYGDCLFTSEREIENNPGRAENFARATLEGWRHVFENPEETLDLVFEKYNPAGLTREHLKYQYRKTKELILPDFIPLGQQNPDRWRRIAQTYASLKMAPEPGNLESFVYDPEKIQVEKSKKLFLYLIAGLGTSVFFIFVFFFWNRSLKKLVSLRTKDLSAEIENRKKAQLALAESLEKYRVLFSSFPLGITVSDAEGKILETNRQAETLLGISQDEHEKREIDGEEWRIVRPDGTLMPPNEWASVKALKEKRLVENCEMGIEKPDGDITWINVTAAPLPVETGGVIVAYGDITAKKTSEKALRESQRRNKAILDAIPDLMFILTRDGRIVDYQANVPEDLAIDEDQLIGTRIADFMPPKTASRIAEGIRSAIDENRLTVFDYRLKVKSGESEFEARMVPYAKDCALAIVRNITEARKIKEALGKSEERFRRFFENSGAYCYIVSPEGIILEANKAALTVLGYEEQELVGKPVSTIYAEESRPKVKELFERWQRTGKIRGAELTLLTGKGDHRTVLLNADAIKDEKGRFIHSTSVQIDVTEWRRTQEQFKAMYDQAPVGIAIVNVENERFQRVNRKFAEIAGYSEEELAKRTVMDITHPDDLQKTVETIDAFKSGKIEHLVTEKRFIRKDGDFRWVKVFGEVLKYPYFEGRHAIAMVQDITENVKAAAALRESEERFRDLFHNAPLEYLSLDENGDCLEVNETWLRTMGFSRVEVVGKSFADFLHPDLRTFFKENYPACKDPGKILGPEFELHKKDGSAIQFFYHGKAGKDAGGRYTATHCVFRNITEQRAAEEANRQLEAQLQQARKMESIGNLAGGVAHDFNNILSSIVGYTELAMEDARKGASPESSLEEIYNAALRASDLVGQILSFSRQSEETKNPLKISGVTEEAVRLLRAALPSTVKIKKDIKSESFVLGNPTQIHQVFMNLFANAAQAMERKGGELTVGLEDIDLEAPLVLGGKKVEPGRYARLTVSDTGNGIPAEIVDRIFEPYFTTKDTVHNTGMGLAVVHGIVKSCGGEIFVESPPGGNTTFTLYFPVTEGTAPNEAAETGELPAGMERILFVDDDATIVRMNRQALERLGYAVTAMTSGAEALELFRSKPNAFDLVITDMTMPEMAGDDLAAEMMEIRPDIPVILCTGHTVRITAEEACVMGVKAFLRKPVLKRVMANTIRKVLESP